jgi:hypothetical protein
MRPIPRLLVPTALDWVGLVILLFLTATSPARAEYRVIETETMRLVYPGPTLQFIAPWTVRCFENARDVHSQLWGWHPSHKVNVILDDFGDYGNAGVWGAPRNSMAIHIAPSSSVYETGPSNERINFTMSHELVHILALDKSAGLDRWARRWFGGRVRETSEHPETMLYAWLTLPRRAAPRWYHEGIAVFMETWLSGGLGRAQGPYDEMVFRAMVRDSAHFYDPLGLESEGTKVDFQIGVNSYLYGTRFMSWLAWEYGPEKLLTWVGRQPQGRMYFAAEFRRVYGLGLGEAWQCWIDWEHEFQRANLEAVRRYPTTQARDLSDRALGSVSRAFHDSTANVIYAAVYHPGAVAHIAAIPLAGGAPRMVREVKGPALYFVCSLAWDPATRTLFYTSDNDEWRDLCSLDPVTGRSRRLIRDARVGDLTFHRADRSLWGVRHFNGISTIVRLPEPWTDWNQVLSFPYGTDVYDLDLSPDGTQLAASVAEIDGRQTLRLFSTAGLLRRDTTARILYDFGSAVPTSFVFSPDGRRLYGSSYYTGVSNIFRYDFDTDSMDVVTNAETGFFRPLPTGGDSLIAFRYTGQGFVPTRIADRPLTDVSAITFHGQRLVEKYPVLQSWKAPSPARVSFDSVVVEQETYRPLTRLGLANIFPIVEGYKNHAAVGLRASVSDPVGMHVFDARATFSGDDDLPADERWHLMLGYTRWNLKAKLRHNPASFYDLVGPTKTSRKGTNASIDWSRPLIRDDPRHLELQIGASGWTGLERLPEAQNVATSPGFDKLLAGHAALTFKNLRASIGAVDHEKGWQWGLESALNGVRFVRGGEDTWRGFPQGVVTLDAGTPLPLRNSSLWLRTAAGYSPGDRDEPFANFFFGGFGNNWLDYQDVKRYRDYSSFPGLEIDEAAGTNFGRALLEWNLPPLRFRRFGTPALYAPWARLSLFGTALGTNVDRDDLRQELANAGAQADLRFQFLTLQPLTFSVGYARAFARGFRTRDEWMVSLKLL